MSALEKPTPQEIEIGQLPADEAGILHEEYPVGRDMGHMVFEAMTRIQALKRSGRLVGIRAIPGHVTLLVSPEIPEIV